MKLFVLFIPAFLSANTPCQLIGTVPLANTAINFTVPAPSATMLGPGDTLVKTPSFCRIGGVIRPSNDSEIHFEVWLPDSAWNGRFRGVGNGGFAGSLNYSEMAAALHDGYATASTDTGHRADGIDADWALGHPEKITDFGYRAIHEMTLKAKAIIQSFYGEAPKHSFFASCSNGGRQALMEAQRFPDDYDGILAGAPANFWTHLLVANFYTSGVPMLENPARYLPKEKIPAIAKAVLAACDASDGLKDGIITDPTSCHFDPNAILCKGLETNNCLTRPQIATLKAVYQGAPGVYPGYEPGGEDGPGGWSAWITGSKPGSSAGALFSTGFLRNMVFNDAKWTYKGTNLADTLATADAKMGPILNSVDPNLKPFADRGGKLIMYHGWSDAAIPPLNAIDYYKSIGVNNLQEFSRLYMLPGVQHCFGGPGPSSYSEMFTSLVAWVEKDAAPSSIVATKFKNDDPSQPIEMKRPMCPYPLEPTYDGKGDPKDASSFSCAAH